MKTPVKVQPVFCDDVFVEQLLRDMQLVGKVAVIPFRSIDLSASRFNGARLGDPMLKDIIPDYKSALARGDVFPRLVVYKTATGYVLLSGNQRATAIAELIKEKTWPEDLHIEVYLVETSDGAPLHDPMLRDVIARCANNGHGARLALDARIVHALYLVNTHGMTITDVCGRCNVSRRTLQGRINADKIRTMAGKRGVNLANVSSAVLEELYPLRHDEGAVERLAVLAGQHGINRDRMQTIVAGVKTAGTEGERRALVKQAADRLSSVEKLGIRKEVYENALARLHKVHRPRRQKFFGKFLELVDFLERGNQGSRFRKLTELQLVGKEDLAEIASLWKRLIFCMEMLLQKGSQ